MSEPMPFIPKQLLDSFIEDSKDAMESRHYYSDAAKNPKYSATEQMILAAIATLNARDGLFDQALYIAFSSINHFNDILSKMPETKEFDELRKELEETKTKTIETLVPLKELLDKLKAAEARNGKGEHIYG